MGMKKQTALMNHWQLCQYLRKLHLPQVVPPPDLATLKLLQDAHLKYVPYENLDILSGRLTSLEHDDMFAKIIMKNRGGICFELNGLYNWLLESLGYKVTSYAARFIDRLEEYQIRRHRVMCIELEDKRYLTDVGVNSESPRCPLEWRRAKCRVTVSANINSAAIRSLAGCCGRRNGVNPGKGCLASRKNRSWIWILFPPAFIPTFIRIRRSIKAKRSLFSRRLQYHDPGKSFKVLSGRTCQIPLYHQY